MTRGQSSFRSRLRSSNSNNRVESGTWFSELFPHMGELSDKACVFDRCIYEAIQSDPRITFFKRFAAFRATEPGGWRRYGLGSTNELASLCGDDVARHGRRSGNRSTIDCVHGVLPAKHQLLSETAGRKDPIFVSFNPAGWCHMRRPHSRHARRSEIAQRRHGRSRMDPR